MSDYHTSVLLKEAVDALHVIQGKQYIDATLGAGGHSFEILERGGRVLGIDADAEALEFVRKNYELRIKSDELKVVQGNFRNIERIAKENGFGKVSGILFDLGVSSHQFDTAERGFSFQKEGPLDMRMSSSLQVRAVDLINGLTETELVELFTKLGEEPRGRSIAKEIVRKRLESPITTTQQLSSIIEQVYKIQRNVGFEKARARGAMRVFQALRIAVNDELNVLKEGLNSSLSLLEENGLLVVISFHSLEDRIVKQVFADFQNKGLGKIITKKPVTASELEVQRNRKSRSAKMRVFEVL